MFKSPPRDSGGLAERYPG